MKSLIQFLFVAVVFFNVAHSTNYSTISEKTKWFHSEYIDPLTEAEWTFKALATPLGDVEGFIKIKTEENKLVGSIADINNNAIPFTALTMENNMVKASFYYETTLLRLEFTITGDTIDGFLSSEGNQFKLSGKKK